MNNSSVRITWIFESNNLQLLNGKFRTFAVTIYENFSKNFRIKFFIKSNFILLDMSTLLTIETINSNFIFNNLHSSSQYYISVSICNYFDCGPSSSAINIEIPSTSKFYRIISIKNFFSY